MKNGTWFLVNPLVERNVVGCRWIFKIKRHANKSISSCKTRLVAKGYNQIVGFDFLEPFSLVIKPSMVRFVLRLAVTIGWILRLEQCFLAWRLDGRGVYDST